MYKTFFGLRECPFNVNPDPRFLYLTPRTRAAMDELTYGIENRKGFILLTGEVGTGKTTLINYLLNWLRARKTPTAFIFNSHLNPNHLFDFILTDFGINVDYRLNSNMLMRLNTWLIEQFREGQTPVLIIDEAQGLSSELLEEIRLLLNLETASEKLLQIVLAGQPELDQKLRRPELRQLQQRITLRCSTGALSLPETHGYIGERLRIAGASGAAIFTSEAMDAVYFYSHGIPRVVNLLCEHALINAYVEHSRGVTARMVEDAAREFLLDEGRPVSIRSTAPEITNTNLAMMHTIFANGLDGPAAKTKDALSAGAQPPLAAAIPVPVLNQILEPAPIHPPTANISDVMVVSQKLEPAPLHETVPMTAALEQNKKLPSQPAGIEAAMPPVKPKPAIVVPIAPALVHESKPARNRVAAASAVVATRRAIQGTNRSRDKAAAPFAAGQPVAKGVQQARPRRYQESLTSVLPDKWSRVSHAALLKTMSSYLLLRSVLHCWGRDFKRDWMAMIHACGFPAMKRSFLLWLSQPIRTWRSPKVGTLHPPRTSVP
jgi:type II secretory pathway predicted ATPase ExeA